MKILIVEDEEADLKLAHQLLKYEGYEVFEARSAEQAIEILKEENPHLIVTDLFLPLMDGFALARYLKKSPQTSHIPLIALTAYPDQLSRRGLSQTDFHAILSKPLSMKDLSSHIISLFA